MQSITTVKLLRPRPIGRVWCAAEPEFYGFIAKALKSWGWDPVYVPQTSSCPDQLRILPEEESSIEDWAWSILEQIKSAPTPLLLVQAELRPTQRSASLGLLLADRVWCQRIVPTIVAAVDLEIACRSSSRRARQSSQQPIITVVRSAQGTSPNEIGFALWDVIAGKEDLDRAGTLARTLVESTVDKDALRKELQAAIISAQTAFYRHRLKGLLASLRILEGAYREGWVSPSVVKHAFETLAARNRTDPDRIAILQSLQDRFRAFPQPPAPRHRSPRQWIWVCDDSWLDGGWDVLLQPMLQNLFGFQVKGFTSLQEMEQGFQNHDMRTVAALLLDVHFSETEQVDGSYLKHLQECYPLIDVVLFTSDLENGWLVREAYELGYRIFYKETEELNKDPRLYARQLAITVQQSVSALPLRALYEFADLAPASAREDDPMIRLRHILRLWRQNPDSALVFTLAPLFERQFRSCYAMQVSSDPADLSNNDWAALENSLWQKIQSGINAAGELWMMLSPLDRKARNALVHYPQIVEDAQSLLPAIGLALPILLSTVALHRLTAVAEISDDEFRKAIKANLIDLYFAILNSNQIVREEVRDLFIRAHAASVDPSAAHKLFSYLLHLVKQNSSMGLDKPIVNDLIRILENINYNLLRHDAGWTFSVLHWTIFLLISCLLDSANVVFLP